MVVTELVAKLGLDVDEAAFDRATSVLKGLGKGLVGLGAAFGAAVVGLGALVNATANAADAIDESAQKAGVTTEALQRLAYAGKFSGLTIESAAHALGILQRNAVNAADGNEELAAAFAKVGISGAELRNMPGNEQIVKMAEAFEGMANGPVKVALAMKVLGKSGAELLPFLNQGGAAIRDLMAEAYVMPEAVIKAGAAFKDEQDKLGTDATALRDAISGPLLEDYTALVRSLRGVVKWTREAVAPKIVTMAKAVGSVFSWIAKNTWALKTALVSLVAFKLAALIPTLSALTATELSWGMAALISGARAWAASVLAASGAVLVQLAWTAAIVALVLLLQDLYTWATGGDSMIGRLIGSWDEFYAKLLSDPGFEKNSPVLAFLVKVLDKIINLKREVGLLLDKLAGANGEAAVRGAESKSTQGMLQKGQSGQNIARDAAYLGLSPQGIVAGMFAQAGERNMLGLVTHGGVNEQLAGLGWNDDEIDKFWNANNGISTAAVAVGQQSVNLPPELLAKFGAGANPYASVKQSSATPVALQATQLFNVEQTINAAPGQSAEDVGNAANAGLADALQGPLQEAAAAINR